MKTEMELLRPFVEPMGEQDNLRSAAGPLRKAMREATDMAIHEALLKSNLPLLAGSMAEVMVVVATTLLTLKQEPEVGDFVYAAKELIEDARKVMDQGLHQQEMQDVRIAAVMLELVSRGICATLALPYDDVFREVHRAHQDGTPPDLEAVLALAKAKEPA